MYWSDPSLFCLSWTNLLLLSCRRDYHSLNIVRDAVSFDSCRILSLSLLINLVILSFSCCLKCKLFF